VITKEKEKDLLDDSLIKMLHRDTGITLQDLLARKIFIEPPEGQSQIEAAFWSLSYDDDLPTLEREQIRGEVKQNPNLIRAAVFVVANASGLLSKKHGYMAYDFTRYFEAHECEIAQVIRRSQGGKSTAEDRKKDAADNIKTAARHWHELEKSGRPKRERGAVIAERMGAPKDTVRRWINQAGLR
jgi:hypothetical protein